MTVLSEAKKPKWWSAAVDEARKILIEYARNEDYISYSKLSSKITTHHIDPHSVVMNTLLEDIFIEEFENGKPLLTAIVTFKNDLRPGNGFYVTSKKLDIKYKDPIEYWNSEVKRAFEHWREH